MKFTITVDVNATTNKVWKVFAHNFNDAYKWMASVPHSYAKNNGEEFDGAQSVGRVCELNPGSKGVKASEKFIAYDEVAKTCTVKIDFVDTPFMFPVHYNTLSFSLQETEANKSKMTWEFSSKIKPLTYLIWPLIRIGFGVFVGQIVEELKYYVENDAPHPRKVKAMKKTEAKA